MPLKSKPKTRKAKSPKRKRTRSSDSLERLVSPLAESIRKQYGQSIRIEYDRGFMRLMLAKQMPHITVLLSYQDTEVHKGTIYKAAGWKSVACNEGADWTTCKRKRNAAQSLAAKVRWEYEL